MNSSKNALKLANRALQDGDNQRTISILLEALKVDSENAELYKALAISYKTSGMDSEALEAINISLIHNEKDIKSHVIKGVLHESKGNIRNAIQSYGNVTRLGAEQFDISNPIKRDIATASSRIPILMKQLEKMTFKTFEEMGINSDKQDTKFHDALNILFGHKEIYYQEPHQFYYPELPQKQFYSPDRFPFLKNISQNWELIRDEATSLIRNPELLQPYLESTAGQPHDEHIAMIDNPDWSAFYFIKNGKDIPENQLRFPETMKAIQSVDLCRTEGGTPSVLFSLLKAGAHIPPHTGMLNTRLICHLPLIVPNNCGLRVGNKTVEWVPGQLIIFDDSINHEAWNNSDQDRIVLIFDIWKPELSERERSLVSKLLAISNQ